MNEKKNVYKLKLLQEKVEYQICMKEEAKNTTDIRIAIKEKELAWRAYLGCENISEYTKHKEKRRIVK